MRNRLLELDRLHKQIITLAFDVIILLIALWISFILRFGELVPAYLLDNTWLFMIIPFLSVPLFIRLGLYRSVLQYVGMKVILTCFKAITISCFAITFFMYFFQENDLPRSIIPIFWFVSNTFIITSRFLLKGMIYSWDTSVNKRKKTIIYGAGNAGVQLVESLKKSVDYAPIAFIDDDQNKHGTIINYLQIFSFSELEKVINKHNVQLILIAIPSASRRKRREIINRLSRFRLEVKVLPSVDNIVNGEVTIDSIKHVDVEDILGREAVKPDKTLLEKNIRNKNILITGAGGSIGSELCRQISLISPDKIILLDNSEFNLYSIHQELESLIKNNIISFEIVAKLGSVTNFHQVNQIISENDIHTVFHAAAYKHVPMVEMNISEGVYNNVIGTYNVAKSARSNNVESMVLISTDKAVRPTNVMGASKRFSELILQAFSLESSSTIFSMVRFGNVLDSAGSVVPLFRKQIKSGGPITVTHPEITRYFMSISEAVALVMQAGAMAKGGDVFVLDMGKPIKILDLAYKMIYLSGFKPVDDKHPDGDINIEFTGIRKGEKLYEELLIGNNVIQSKHPRIMQANEYNIDIDIVEETVNKILDARKVQDDKSIQDLLIQNINEYQPSTV